MAEESPAPTRNDLILDLFHQEKSTEEISRAVHASFGNFVGTSEINAVVHRAKLRNDPRAMRAPSKKGRGQTSFNNGAFGRRGTRKAPRLPEAAPPPPKEVSATAVLLMKAGPRQCRFPLNSDKRRLIVCGAPTPEKSSYCPYHRATCYDPKS